MADFQNDDALDSRKIGCKFSECANFSHFSFSHFNEINKISIAQLINLMALKCDRDDDDAAAVAVVAAEAAFKSVLFEFWSCIKTFHQQMNKGLFCENLVR